jgi:hypothetical protein
MSRFLGNKKKKTRNGKWSYNCSFKVPFSSSKAGGGWTRSIWQLLTEYPIFLQHSTHGVCHEMRSIYGPSPKTTAVTCIHRALSPDHGVFSPTLRAILNLIRYNIVKSLEFCTTFDKLVKDFNRPACGLVAFRKMSQHDIHMIIPVNPSPRLLHSSLLICRDHTCWICASGLVLRHGR